MEILHIFRTLFIIVLSCHHCELTKDVNNTAGEEIDGQYLETMGKILNKPELTLIAMAINNLHPCGEWASWTACTATILNHFGIRSRIRKCGVNGNIKNSEKIKTEKDFSICGGMCPEQYSLTTQFCIKVYTVAKNQEDAEKQCQSDGGNLITIDTKEKYEDVMNLSGLPTSYIYIGGRRKDINSPWLFKHGVHRVGFFNWASGQPDNGSDQFCMVLKGSDKLMYDGWCSTSRQFICEVDIGIKEM